GNYIETKAKQTTNTNIMSDHNLPVEEHPPLIVLNPDGSYTRPASLQNSPPTSDQDSDTPVLTKDLTINHVNKTGVCIHIPKETMTTTETRPLKINGMILHNPFFGGVKRMDSEIRYSGANFTLSMSDECWDWALPIGASRDHEYCNPMMGGGLDAMGRIKDAGWRVVVTARLGDLMIDRQMEFVKALESKGVECKCFYGDGDHGIEYMDNIKAQELCDEISSYLSSITR
ncbi:hypothetical protein M8C21_012601, partial [Ambrosia artemisiifolia]